MCMNSRLKAPHSLSHITHGGVFSTSQTHFAKSGSLNYAGACADISMYRYRIFPIQAVQVTHECV